MGTSPSAQHRVKLAELWRNGDSLAAEGVNVSALWRPGQCALAVLVRGGSSASQAIRCAAPARSG